MVGWFKLVSTQGEQCIASSEAVQGVQAKLVVPPLYRSDVSPLRPGDVVFAVTDDSSGFGAILYKRDDGVASGNALNLSHDLSVQGNARVSGAATVSGDMKVGGTLSGKNFNTLLMLTPDNVAIIAGAMATGTAAELSHVQVIMGA